MAYQVLARGWRPQRFDEIVGQDAVVMTLKNALAAERLGHAYLFSGLRGVGKTTAARLLAKAVNCASGPAAEPCNDCVSCSEIAQGSSLDVVELDGASNRGIDDVRELRDLLRYRPTRDRYRVIIIDEVHMLTREAFNALLKSLEEPPPYIIFILATTERQKVPATILSRCQQLDFRPVASGRISARLREVAEGEGFSLSLAAADMVARAAEGSVRDALSLVDQLRAFADDEVDESAVEAVLGVPRAERIVRLLELLAAGDAGAGLTLLREELRSGHDASVLYQETGRTLRILVHLAVDPGLEPSLTDEHRTLLESVAATYDAAALGRMLGLWLEQESLLRDSSNRELALEVACLRLARWPAVRRVEGLIVGGGPAQVPEGGGGPPAPTRPASGGSMAAPRESGSKTLAPGPRLSRALWQAKRQQLAGAVDKAEVELDGSKVFLRFNRAAEGLARLASAEVEQLAKVCSETFSGASEVKVEVEEGEGSLEQRVLQDPKVALVQKVLGGEIVGVRPNGDGG